MQSQNTNESYGSNHGKLLNKDLLMTNKITRIQKSAYRNEVTMETWSNNSFSQFFTFV